MKEAVKKSAKISGGPVGLHHLELEPYELVDYLCLQCVAEGT